MQAAAAPDLINEGGEGLAPEADGGGVGANSYVTVVRPYDVVLGRGAPISQYPGNVRFREVIAAHKSDYMNTGRHQRKQWIARQVCKTLQSRNVRFLRKLEAVERDVLGVPQDVANAFVVNDDLELAMKKIKQALREGDDKSPPRPAQDVAVVEDDHGDGGGADRVDVDIAPAVDLDRAVAAAAAVAAPHVAPEANVLSWNHGGLVPPPPPALPPVAASNPLLLMHAPRAGGPVSGVQAAGLQGIQATLQAQQALQVQLQQQQLQQQQLQQAVANRILAQATAAAGLAGGAVVGGGLVMAPLGRLGSAGIPLMPLGYPTVAAGAPIFLPGMVDVNLHAANLAVQAALQQHQNRAAAAAAASAASANQRLLNLPAAQLARSALAMAQQPQQPQPIVVPSLNGLVVDQPLYGGLIAMPAPLALGGQAAGGGAHLGLGNGLLPQQHHYPAAAAAPALLQQNNAAMMAHGAALPAALAADGNEGQGLASSLSAPRRRQSGASSGGPNKKAKTE